MERIHLLSEIALAGFCNFVRIPSYCRGQQEKTVEIVSYLSPGD